MTACVVVPVYRERPEWWELLSLTQLSRRLGHYPTALIAPTGLDLSRYAVVLGDPEVHYFDPVYFRARLGSPWCYSALMVSKQLYQQFKDWEFILIHQTDAFVFEDQLDEWTRSGFDYVGPPFVDLHNGKKRILNGGNGGLSLRRVDAFRRVLKQGHRWPAVIGLALPHSKARSLRRAKRGEMSEDIYWSSAPIAVAPTTTAVRFAFESALEFLEETYATRVPFGCHRIWNLEYIDALQNGTPIGREPHYENVLRNILERSGNLSRVR